MIEPLCGLEGLPCFTHDGRYLGRGPLRWERYERAGHRRPIEAFDDFDVETLEASNEVSVHYGVAEAVGSDGGRYDGAAVCWRATDELSSRLFEMELIGWRIRKLEAFRPSVEHEYRRWGEEMDWLENRRKELRKMTRVTRSPT